MNETTTKWSLSTFSEMNEEMSQESTTMSTGGIGFSWVELTSKILQRSFIVRTI